MLLDMGQSHSSPENERVLGKILSATFFSDTRDRCDRLVQEQRRCRCHVYRNRRRESQLDSDDDDDQGESTTCATTLSSEQFAQTSISFHLFPEEWDQEIPRQSSDPTLYPDLSKREEDRRFLRDMKRVIDVAGQRVSGRDPCSAVSDHCARDQDDIERAGILSADTSRAARRTVCIFKIPVHVCRLRLQCSSKLR